MDRLEKISGIMKDLDAVLLLSEISRFYASGLRTSAGAAVITKRGGHYATDFRYIEYAETSAAKGWSISRIPPKTGYAKHLEPHLSGAKRIGYEADRITVSEHEAWQRAYPEAEWVSISGDLSGLRAQKDFSEIQNMTAAQRISEKTFHEIINGVLHEGMTEKELGAELQYRMLLHGAERMSFEPIVVSGPNSSMPHGVPSDRVITRGDFVTMDFGCVYGGYCSDMTRTVAIGTASDEMRRVYDIVLRAQAAGIAAAKAGVAGNVIDGAARDIISNEGYGDCFGHGFGHSLGLEVHEAPNANMSETRAMPEGAVISAEPGIYIPGKFGVRIEDVIVITKSGCDNITRAPKELIVI